MAVIVIGIDVFCNSSAGTRPSAEPPEYHCESPAGFLLRRALPVYRLPRGSPVWGVFIAATPDRSLVAGPGWLPGLPRDTVVFEPGSHLSIPIKKP